MTLRWCDRKPGDMFIRTVCDRYHVDVADMGPDHMPYRWIFTAWAVGRPSENLGVAKTAALAKALCEDHVTRTTELEFIPMESQR